MNRKKITLIAIIVATILGIIPVVTATLLIYRHTRIETINKLKIVANDTTQNSERILDTINRTLSDIPTGHITCNQATVTELQKIIFISPEISGIFIASPDGKVQCTSLGIVDTKLPTDTDFYLHRLHMIGPVKFPGITKPFLVIYKKTADNYFVGAMVLPEIFTNLFANNMTEDGFVGLVNLHNNHLYVSQGSIPELQKTYHFQEDEHTYVNLKIKLNKYTNPIIIAQKIFHLRYTYAIAAQPSFWLTQILWQQIALFGSIGLLLSIIFIMAVLKAMHRRLSLQGELERAINKKEFYMHYQPVIDLALNRCVGVEALIRWQHPEHGLIMPDSFIPLAETTNQITRITEWLIPQCLEDLQSILQADRTFHVAINIGAKFFADERTVQLICQACQRYDIAPQQIILELTERELIQENDTAVIEVMQKLRASNVALALDDFGTGYSSYSYLQRFPFSYLKIDYKFTKAIGTGAITEQLVDSIIDMAHKLQMYMIAEGVETQQQRDYLKSKHVKFAQGWLYAKAMNIAELSQFLLEKLP